MAKPDFDPSDAVEFWICQQAGLAICESVQRGMKSRAFTHGYYAPMEDASLGHPPLHRRRLGDDAVASDAQ